MWADLQPAQKKRLVFFMFVIGVSIVGLVGYYLNGGKKAEKKEEVKKEEKKELTFDTKLLEKTQILQAQSDYQKAKNELPDLVKKAVGDILTEKKKEEEKDVKKQPVTGNKSGAGFTVPPPPPPGPSANPFTAANPQPVPPQNVPAVPQKPQVELVGGIEIVSAKSLSGKEKGKTLLGDKNEKQGEQKEQPKEEDDKKKVRKLYLPPSFMEATLLSGLDAPTVESGKGDPLPVFLRIKTPAILPNQIKSNLKGCFVIAEGFGKLSDERAHLRLTTLSCIDKKGQAVIDQDIKGNVIDSDGKIGLKGRVVSKMGANLARAAMIGVLGGIGDAVKTSSYTTFTGTAGSTQVINPSAVGIAAIGGGISKATDELQKFYLDMAKQTTPVIEIGATRVVTIAITKGIELELKERAIKY